LTTRWTARAPITLFQAGLGFVFAGRLLMLEHRGRKSGQRRYVVLEVVAKESRASYLVASGFGRGSQWFQNIVAEPRCGVSVGTRRRVPAQATVLTREEADAVLAAYQRHNPRLWAELRRTITDVTADPHSEIPIVRLSLRE
jgi:deazaflavin-dependent oxidoreductase (nitroreductase family)